MKRLKNYLFCVIGLACGFLVLNFIGCATVPPTAPPRIEGVPGIYHKAEKGQTLWKISKIYDIDLDEIIRINRIQDATNIEVGQMIFIPNRSNPQPVPSVSSSDDFIWPLNGRIIAYFGQTYKNMLNKGLNIEPTGKTDIVAARSGRISFYAPNFGVFGKTIIIDHGDGFSTVYARNSDVFIKVGQNVERGSVIAKAGSNQYFHFEIRKGYISQNPLFYLP